MQTLRRFLHRFLYKFQHVLGLHYRPEIQTTCYHVRHGSDYGGWVIHPNDINKDSIVYSFGVGEDISFDLAMIEKYDCEVYAFDPTPRSIGWIRRQPVPPKLHFLEYGIGDTDGIAVFYAPSNNQHVSFSILENSQNAGTTVQAPVKTLATIAKELNHRHIDILKLDIEGSEYSVIPTVLASDIKITQILIEFHHRFSSMSEDATRRVIEQLNKYGYKLFYVSKSGEECSFIHE